MNQLPLAKLSAFDEKTEQWNAVIETPKGAHNKYAYDDDIGAFKLNDVLPSGLEFPFDYGFLPSTLAADGDPIDVLLLMDYCAFPGCVVPSRLVGVIEAEQTEANGETERNDRLVAVPIKARVYGNLKSLKDLDPKLIEDIERFFITYDQAFGKKFKPLGVRGPGTAEKLAQDAIKEFERKAKK